MGEIGGEIGGGGEGGGGGYKWGVLRHGRWTGVNCRAGCRLTTAVPQPACRPT